nr:aspartyl protease family protein [uncultured Microbacterium sp.]
MGSELRHRSTGGEGRKTSWREPWGPSPATIRPPSPCTRRCSAKRKCVRASWGGVETDVLWDSGAEVTVIDEAFAARHAHLLDPLGAADAGDARGASRRVEVVRMAAVTIGGRSFPPSTAVVTPLAGMRRPGEPPLDVILGVPVLRRADWTLHLAEGWWGYPSASA